MFIQICMDETKTDTSAPKLFPQSPPAFTHSFQIREAAIVGNQYRLLVLLKSKGANSY